MNAHGMNCDQAREKLIDLVYGELEAAEEQAVREHVQTCDRCRGELAELQLARSAVARYRAGEPESAGLKSQVDRATAPGRPRLGRLRLRPRPALAACAGIAAAALIVIAIWTLHERAVQPAYGQQVPEIKRLSVSLTILSEPERRRGRGYYRGRWPGMALVRDQRIVRRLKRGATEVAFTDVPAAILPDTVRLRSLDAPEGLAIVTTPNIHPYLWRYIFI